MKEHLEQSPPITAACMKGERERWKGRPVIKGQCQAPGRLSTDKDISLLAAFDISGVASSPHT